MPPGMVNTPLTGTLLPLSGGYEIVIDEGDTLCWTAGKRLGKVLSLLGIFT